MFSEMLVLLCDDNRIVCVHTALELADSVLAAEGVRDTAGLVSWGIGPLATVSCTLSEALCRMPIACWWVTVWSRGWPLMAKIWSASLSFPSLQKERVARCDHI